MTLWETFGNLMSSIQTVLVFRYNHSKMSHSLCSLFLLVQGELWFLQASFTL